MARREIGMGRQKCWTIAFPGVRQRPLPQRSGGREWKGEGNKRREMDGLLSTTIPAGRIESNTRVMQTKMIFFKL